MGLFGDVVLTPEALATVSAIVGALVSAIVFMYRAEDRRREDQLADLKRQRDDLLRVLLRAGMHDSIPPSVPVSVIPPPRPRPDDPARPGG